MELTINREALLKAVARCKDIAARRTTVPVLSHVLIEHQDSNVYLSATDLDIGARTIIPLFGEGTDGTFTVSCHKLSEILKATDVDNIEIKTLDNDWVELKAGKARFKLMGLDPRSFGALPESKNNTEEGTLTLEAGTLRTMIDRVIFAVSADEARYNLSGVYVEGTSDAEIARFVATDGHRLAYIQRPATGFTLAKGVIIPRHGLVEARKLLEGYEGSVSLRIDGSTASIEACDTVLTMRLVEGEFPDYCGVIPKDRKFQFTVNATELAGATKRVRLFANDRVSAVKLAFDSGNALWVSSNSSGAGEASAGEASDEVDVEHREGPIEEIAVGINAAYILDALKVMPEESAAQIALSDEVSPVVFTIPTDENYKVVIMPCRI